MCKGIHIVRFHDQLLKDVSSDIKYYINKKWDVDLGETENDGLIWLDKAVVL